MNQKISGDANIFDVPIIYLYCKVNISKDFQNSANIKTNSRITEDFP